MAKIGYLRPGHDIGNNPRDRGYHSQNYNLFLRPAKIVRVDHEAMQVDLIYQDSPGLEMKVPVTQGYTGARSFLGAMPSVGDFCIVGFTKAGGLSAPMIVTFFPASYKSGVNNDIIGSIESVKDIYGEKRFKMRKLYEGEIFLSSNYGSDIYLDKNIKISNSSLNEILLKSSDQSLNFSAVNTYFNNSGVRSFSGLIHRNKLIDDPDFKVPNPEFPVYYNSDGVPYYTPNLTSTITSSNPYGKETINDDNPGFIEHRLEVKEYDDPIMPVTFSNSGVDVDSFYQAKSDGNSTKPLIVQVLGTLVGNDPVSEKYKYGTILKPKLFFDSNSTSAKMEEVSCVADSGLNESTSLAAAYTLKLPNTSTAFYINKQGKYFANIASSSNLDPMGSGESAELNLEGHTRISMGKNTSKNRSLSLNTTGGVYTNWGFDNDKGRSWDATFRKGVSWNILGSDRDGLSFSMRVASDMRYTVEGTRYTEIKGSDIRIVYGVTEDRYLGKKVNQYVGDFNNTYGGKLVEMTVGHCNQTYASGISRTIVAPDIAAGSSMAESTQIKLGSSEHKMLFGSKTEQINVGSYSTKVGLGNRSVDINVGNYSVSCKLGNISIKTNLGTVDVKTNGQVTVEGKLGVKIKSALKVTVEAPFVDMGKLKPLQGIVTGGPLGHKDYITGLPLIGSMTCKASAT